MKKLLFFLVLITAVTSCKIYRPSVMLQTEEEYKFTEIPDSIDMEYHLAENDIVTFRLYSNDGFKLIDVMKEGGGSSQQFSAQFQLPYKIEFDGKVKLPILGRVKLSGYTLREAELFLEERYNEYYNKAYVILNVTNKRVIIFPGQIGKAQVIYLTNNNTTLLEALALAGGLGRDAKAYNIKLIRGDRANPEVFQLDLSTIEGMKSGSMVMQANDIVYVDQRYRVLNEITTELAPIIQLMSTTISLVTTFVLLRSLR